MNTDQLVTPQNFDCPYCGTANSPQAPYCKRCLKLFRGGTEVVESNIIKPAGFQCPFCHSDRGYLIESKTSGAGCVLAILLLIFFFPLFWIGLLMKEENKFCANCHLKLG